MILLNKEIVSIIQKDHLYHLMLKGERADGRAFDEFRDISIQTDYIDKAEGSAKVELGNTKVIVGVKIMPGTPFPDTPDSGVIITSAELIHLASPEFESGPPRENAIEVARVTDRGIRESGAIDLKKLCVVEGEKVWMVFIDIHVLDDCGNLMNVSALGAIAALLTAKMPKERFGLGEDVPLPIRDIPVSITAVDIGGGILFDPTIEEENVAECKLTVIFNQEGAISGMQKSGNGSLTSDQLNNIVEISCKKAQEIRKKFLEI
ncbi:MAG: exosome complex component RRP42 [Candidatus Methanomarinus sp.]|nr:MAG: exosome complex component RRP42 [ANME-2 cluster archaeon]